MHFIYIVFKFGRYGQIWKYDLYLGKYLDFINIYDHGTLISDFL